jgi:APA family basic amino acid/polyamine antiporter
MNQGFERRYGLITAICMVVGIVIGSGVFFKAQTILQATNGNMPLGIMAWIIGGVIMLVCSLAFASMATKYEKVNGIVDYAEATIGHKYAYFIGWFMTTIYYPTLTSVLAWLSARYTLVFVQSCDPVGLKDLNPVTGPECMVLTLFFLCAAYFVNAISPRLAGKFQVGTTFIKLIPLALMAVVGIIYGISSGQLTENFTHTVQLTGAMANPVNVNPLFGAVVATAFAYEGWIIATSINSELKDAKKNLPKALTLGAIIVMAVYIFYYVGVAGGASNKDLIYSGATVAFINIFGNVFGNVLNLFIAISCMGTMNGLMLGCTRGLYSVAARGRGPSPQVYKQVDPETNMSNNSAIVGLMLCACWFVFFYGANLAPVNWFGVFGFDSSELTIVTIYGLYIPIFIMFMKKAEGMSTLQRYVWPILAICGSAFMVIAAIYAHGYKPYVIAKAAGGFAIPIVFYLIVFAVIMVIGIMVDKGRKSGGETEEEKEDEKILG